jgi:hypothetical protein
LDFVTKRGGNIAPMVALMVALRPRMASISVDLRPTCRRECVAGCMAPQCQQADLPRDFFRRYRANYAAIPACADLAPILSAIAKGLPRLAGLN